MPEGHSIRRLALAFEELFVGQACALSSPQGRFAAGAALLDGRVMTEAHSYGKHLFLGFGDRWIHVHLGLYGAWRFSGSGMLPAANRSIGAPRIPVFGPDEGMTLEAAGPGEWQAPAPRGAVRLRVLTDLSVADLTGPTRCEVLDEVGTAGVLARLGPDPLVNDPGMRARFVSLVRASSRPIGELVMDQGIAAGVGNIYRAEGLFRVGISPLRPGSRVSAARLAALWDDFAVLLARGVDEGRIRTVEPVDAPESEADPEARQWYVYHRDGRPCLRCGATIRAQDLRGRRLFWCPGCQR